MNEIQTTTDDIQTIFDKLLSTAEPVLHLSVEPVIIWGPKTTIHLLSVAMEKARAWKAEQTTQATEDQIEQIVAVAKAGVSKKALEIWPTPGGSEPLLSKQEIDEASEALRSGFLSAGMPLFLVDACVPTRAPDANGNVFVDKDAAPAPKYSAHVDRDPGKLAKVGRITLPRTKLKLKI